MKRLALPFLLVACATPTAVAPPPTPPPAAPVVVDAGAPVAVVEDPNLWLEEVTGEKPLAWVKVQDERSTQELTADPRFAPLQERLLTIYNSKARIPWPMKQGTYFYNFWRDDTHVRGVWRRVASLAEYQKPAPAWETVLDLDALAAAEKENWVWGGANCLYPKHERCLLSFSRGGADAVVVREFDTVKKAFVAGGFSLPEAKSQVAWKDQDTLYVGTDFGPGSLTDSGYARLSKEWKRGTKLADAKLLYEGQKTDVVAAVARSWDHGHVYDFVLRSITFYEQESFLLTGEKAVKLDVPVSANVDTWDDQLLVSLRDDWTVGGTTWPKGSLLVTSLPGFLKGERTFTALFTPTPHSSLTAYASLKSGLVLNALVDVHNVLTVWTKKGATWSSKPLDVGAGLGTVNVTAVTSNDLDELWVDVTDFTQPYALSYLSLGKKPQPLKQTPAFFDAQGLTVEQHFATSRDGTKVPYFQVARAGLALDGQNPTLLTGYGGFEVSLQAGYDATAGAAWLEKGGVYVQANLRGGGEYGPGWHQAAVKANRQAAYDDFAAVAEDLSARKVTNPKKLGISGASNGGLLMGVMLTQRPELFGAIVCMVPLLDMKRYSQLLAGASWMSEYGDPTVPAEWAPISKYSPYQNVKATGHYPRTLFTTSTRDDRVHPGHARKMVARMLEQGHDVLYYENVEGGHGGAANNAQRAFMSTLEWVFLTRQLGL
jgi:prolyl oligopeptidase